MFVNKLSEVYMAVAQINDILHKRIKIFAAQNSMKISEVIEKAFNEFEKKKKKTKEKDIL